MQKVLKNHRLLIVMTVFAIMLMVMALILVKIGQAYRDWLLLTNVSNTKPIVFPSKVKKVKRVTIQKNGELSCIEVGDDGVVRVYSDCGNALENAHRLTNLKNILKLLQLAGGNLFLTEPPDGDYYTLTIETDEGTQIVYITKDSPGGDEIIETIEDIEGDLPDPSPSTPLASIQASSSPFASTQPSGSAGGIPSPTPGGGSNQESFFCEFSESPGQEKPYSISNIICSTEPSPLP